MKGTRGSLSPVDGRTERIRRVRGSRTRDWKPSRGRGNPEDGVNQCCRRNVESWKLRNDSTGVGRSLCADYVYRSPWCGSESMPEVRCCRKIQLVSKRQERGECLDNQQRKPVKGCYCNLQFRKTRSLLTKTQRERSSPCVHCESQFELKLDDLGGNGGREEFREGDCEGLGKGQSGQNRTSFYRNLQAGDCPELDSFCYHKLHTGHDNRSGHLEARCTNVRDSVQKSVSESLDKPYPHCVCDQYERLCAEKHAALEKQSKSKLSTVKKTTSSKKFRSELKNDVPHLATRLKNKTAPECTQEPSDYLNKSRTPPRTSVCTSRRVHSDQPKEETHPKYKLEHKSEFVSDKQIEDIRNFREQNYFDTHGSSRLLFSPASSGSLEQYVLNGRLFPKRVQSIHRKDLVLTIPPCATTEGKRVHYFPRYIVRQEKSRSAGHKKRRCQSCPLTGHAVDLGVLKEQPPVNSLALKYQKRWI